MSFVISLLSKIKKHGGFHYMTCARIVSDLWNITTSNI